MAGEREVARRSVTDEATSEALSTIGRLRRGQVVPLLAPLVRAVVRGDVDEGSQPGGALRRDTVYRRTLAAADLVAVAGALVTAVVVLGDDRLAVTALAALPLLVLVAKAVGLYDRDQHLLRKTTLDEAPTVFQVATLYALMAWLAGGLFVDGSLGRDQVLGLWGLLFVSMLAGRVAARRLARGIAVEERCLILGEGPATEWAAAKLSKSEAVNAEVVGWVPLSGDRHNGNGVSALGRLDALAELIEEHRVERVVIVPERSDSEEMLNLIRLVKALGVKVSVLPRLFEVVGSSVEFDDVEGMTLLGVRRYGLTTSSRLLKRGMDVTGSLAVLALLAPLLGAVAVAIKLGSRGPVLFRQRRVGQDDREFHMLKFRTMVDGADEQKADLRERNEAGAGLFKIADDPRLTAVGGFLRRTSLDELPQLVNVLRGEMSLVGPRPLVVDEDRHVEGWDRRRLQLPPGMTGPWQVFGSSRIPLREMVKIDYRYGANWSLWSDVKILLRTLPHVLGRRGM